MSSNDAKSLSIFYSIVGFLRQGRIGSDRIPDFVATNHWWCRGPPMGTSIFGNNPALIWFLRFVRDAYKRVGMKVGMVECAEGNPLKMWSKL